MRQTHHRLSLSDGRTLSFTDCGPEHGTPHLYLHGNPGSRTEVLSPDYLAAFEAAGLRVITLDRPGYGASSPPALKGHQNLGGDIAQLLDRLQLEEVRMTGYSRGTLPALAVAVSQGARIRSIGLFGATGMPDDPQLLSALPATARLMLNLVKHTPHVATAILGVNHQLDRLFPASRAQRMKAVVPSRFDHQRLQARGAEITQALYEGTQDKPAFIIEDWRSWLVHPLGFKPEKVECPVLVWTGEDDQTCPPSSAGRLAARIPRGQFRAIEGYGHLHSPEILVELMQALP